MGIEPTQSAWKAEVLPLNYTRITKYNSSLQQNYPILTNSYFMHLLSYISFIWWRGKDSNLRRQSRQIYSLIPLTAREPLQKERYSLS